MPVFEPPYVDADFDWMPYSARVLRTNGGTGLFAIGEVYSGASLVELKISDLVDAEPPFADLEVVWSSCTPKCALYLRGKPYVVVNLESGDAVVDFLSDYDVASTEAQALFRDLPLSRGDQSRFCHARAAHWQQQARNLGSRATPLSPSEEATKGFLVSGRGDAKLYGVFEQHHDTGDLYVFDNERGEILGWIQIFTDAGALKLDPEDVSIVWSQNTERVGAVICGGLRGVVDCVSGQKGRNIMRDRSTRPISHPDWLAGFEWWEQRTGSPRPILPRDAD